VTKCYVYQLTKTWSRRRLLSSTRANRPGYRSFASKGSISTSEYVAATGAPVRTAYCDLQDLVERGLLLVRGKRRGARYYLV
jgi:Fic family protein